MTTDTKTYPVPATRAARFGWRRFLAVFGTMLLALLVFASVAAFAYARMNDGRIMPGVSVSGVDVAGLTPQQATDKLRSALPDVSAGALTLTVGTVEQRIGYSEIGRQYSFADSIQTAMSVGREGNPLDQLGQQLRTMFGGVTITPAVEYDQQELADRVQAVVARAEVTPVNASITFENGEYVVTPAADGQAVDGEEAVRQALAALDTSSTNSTQVSIPAVTVPAEISTPAAEAAVERAQAVTSTPLYLAVGATTETISSQTLRGWVRLEESSPGQWTLIVERAPIEQLVGTLKAELDQPAVDAEFRFESGEPVAVAGQVGYEVDAAAAADEIYNALHGRGSGTPADRVTLPVNSTTPAFTTEQAEALVDQVALLGKWTTRYVPGVANDNGQNIRRPANLIDGYVVQPGAQFDFVGVAGPITKENGYGDGAAIIGGKTRGEGVLGGGLCTASTTMFNAALRAGFQIDERRNHAYYIDRYPVGLDATIWISGRYVQTMIFTNDSEYPIVIRGINRRGAVTFQVWGVPDGRTVELSTPDVSQRRKAQSFYQFTDKLPPRAQERDEYPVDGYYSVVMRTVRDANGNVLHQDRFTSNYARVDGIILVGRAPGDPKAGTKILVSQGLPPVGSTPHPGPSPEPDSPADTEPVAGISYTLLNNGRVSFSDNSKRAVSWLWDFGGGFTSTERNPGVAKFVPGRQQVTLTVTDADGDTSTARVRFTIAESGETPPENESPADSPDSTD